MDGPPTSTDEFNGRAAPLLEPIPGPEPAGQVADELRRFVSTKSGPGLLNGSRGRTERSGPWCPRPCDYLVPLAAVLVMRNRYGASRVSTAPLAMFEITTVKLSFVEHWVKDWETVELLKR